MPVISKSYKADVYCDLLINKDVNEPVDIAPFVTAVRVDKQFYDASFPVYTLEMKLTGDLMKQIQDNEIAFNLRVDVRDVLDEGEYQEREIINEVLIPFDKPEYVMNYDDANTEIGEDQTDSNTIPRYDYTIDLLSDKDYGKNKILINQVYSEIRPKEAALNIINKVLKGSEKEVFVEPIDNNKRYTNIIIPPMNFIPSMIYLQTVYGMYNNGLKVFIDNGNVYLLRKTGRLKLEDATKQSIDIVFATESQVSSEYAGQQGIRLDTDNNVIEVITAAEPMITNISDTTSHIVGENVVFGSYTNIYDLTRNVVTASEIDQSKSTDTQPKTKYYWNNFDNPIFEDEFINEMKETSLSLSFVWNEIDPTYFNIINDFNIQSTSESLNGSYRIQQLVYSLSSTNTANEFNIIGRSTFNKIQ